jgi:hypothetical protein
MIQRYRGHFARLAFANPSLKRFPAMSIACVQQRLSARNVVERWHTLEKILLSS